MAAHSFSVEIAAPPGTVYDLWMSPDRWPEWAEGMTRVSDLDGAPGQPGARWTVWFGRTSATVAVVVGERPRRFTWRVRLGPLSAEFDATFDPSGSGTRMTETVRTRGVLGWLWNRVLSTGSRRGSFRGELQTFARICEREAAASTARVSEVA